jgi:hypothetical protein
MFTNRLFYMLIVIALLMVTACAPQAELTPTDVPPIVPTVTAQPTEAPTEIKADSLFPTGKFLHPTDSLRYFLFTEDGNWSHWYDKTQLAAGTYSVEGNLYIQTSNSGGWPVPMRYEYTFDGNVLTFQLTEESNNDSCSERKKLYNNKTYTLSE